MHQFKRGITIAQITMSKKKTPATVSGLLAEPEAMEEDGTDEEEAG